MSSYLSVNNYFSAIQLCEYCAGLSCNKLGALVIVVEAARTVCQWWHGTGLPYSLFTCSV